MVKVPSQGSQRDARGWGLSAARGYGHGGRRQVETNRPRLLAILSRIVFTRPKSRYTGRKAWSRPVSATFKGEVLLDPILEWRAFLVMTCSPGRAMAACARRHDTNKTNRQGKLGAQANQFSEKDCAARGFSARVVLIRGAIHRHQHCGGTKRGN